MWADALRLGETTMHSSRFALALAGMLGLAGCNASEIGPAGPPPGEVGRSAFLLTDAPFPFDRITRVDIHIDEIAVSATADTGQGAQGWISVARPNRAFNLLDLQNGVTALLGEADVPPDQYRAVRMTVDPGKSSMTDRDGGKPSILWGPKGEIPSLYSLVEEAMAIDENGEDIVIDFDVGRSFLTQPGSDDFIFIPHLRAITRAGSGSISGTLVNEETDAPIPFAVVSIHLANDTVITNLPLISTTRTDADGVFHASFLRPGPYTVVPEDLERSAVGPSRTVDVRAGQTTQAGEFRF
jgi:hypothetical protein